MKCKHCGHDTDAPVTFSIVVDQPGQPVAAPCTLSGCHYSEIDRLRERIAQLEDTLKSADCWVSRHLGYPRCELKLGQDWVTRVTNAPDDDPQLP